MLDWEVDSAFELKRIEKKTHEIEIKIKSKVADMLRTFLWPFFLVD